MTKNDPTKKPRAYRSAHRSQMALETRNSILKAADDLFRSRGWEKTSITAIAREAGVSAETIYSVFGNKRTVIKQLVVDTVRRDQPGLSLSEQQKPRAVFAAPSQIEKIALFARDVTEVLARVAPLIEVVRTAAAADAGLAELYTQLQSGRRENISLLVAALADIGPLQSALDRESATWEVWRLASPELYTLMVTIEGASDDAYANWLSRTLQAVLLPN